MSFDSDILIPILVVIIVSFFSIRSYTRSFPKRTSSRYMFNWLLPRQELSLEHKSILEKISLYNKLNADDKRAFETRVQKFIEMKRFIPKGSIKKVTTEMKLLIAGTAIQLTYGYPNVYFYKFRTIFIYPDKYYSKITNKFHYGEVNAGGVIVLAWNNFMTGITDRNDGINLGLHEMAHALQLLNIVDDTEYDFNEKPIMDQYEEEAKKEIKMMIDSPDKQHFFRSYATANLKEFFSVTVECFFERSKEFLDYHPKMYRLLTKILNVDPLLLYPGK